MKNVQLKSNDLYFLDILIANDLEVIKKGFTISNSVGNIFLQDTIVYFENNYLN